MLNTKQGELEKMFIWFFSIIFSFAMAQGYVHTTHSLHLSLFLFLTVDVAHSHLLFVYFSLSTRLWKLLRIAIFHLLLYANRALLSWAQLASRHMRTGMQTGKPQANHTPVEPQHTSTQSRRLLKMPTNNSNSRVVNVCVRRFTHQPYNHMNWLKVFSPHKGNF